LLKPLDRIGFTWVQSLQRYNNTRSAMRQENTGQLYGNFV